MSISNTELNSVSNSKQTVIEEAEQKELENNSNGNTNKNNVSEVNASSPSELLIQAIKFMESEEWNKAVDAMTTALELIESENNSNNIESAEYYFAYGKSLLHLVQKKSNLFAIDTAVIDEQYEEEDEDNDLEVNHDNINNNNNNEHNNNEQKESTKEENENKEEELKNENENENESMNNNNTENVNENEMEKDVSMTDTENLKEDREVAWENLEMARVLVQKYLSEHKNNNACNKEEIEKYTLLLVDILSYLGQHLLEDDRFKDAIEEFNKALTIMLEWKKNNNNNTKHNRCVASVYFWLLLANNLQQTFEDGLKCCQSAMKELNDRIYVMLKDILKLDINENKINPSEVYEFSKKYLEDNNNNDNNNNNNEVMKELNSLVDLMSDLMVRLKDCSEAIEENKNRINKNMEMLINDDIDENGEPGNVFAAMIANIIAKNGISQQELNTVEESVKNDDENDENKNNLNGVTTIGFGHNNNNNNNNKEESEEIHELGTFRSNKNQNKDKKQSHKLLGKRKFNETEMEPNLPSTKKIKLNSEKESVISSKNE